LSAHAGASLLMIIAISTTQVWAEDLPVPSSWKNQRGSIVTFASKTATGELTGTFKNQFSQFPQCLDTFDLAGTTSGDQVKFVSTMKNQAVDCHDLVAWTGTLSNDTLKTAVELAEANPATGTIAKFSSQDVFARQP
jgi:hypothetical protein